MLLWLYLAELIIEKIIIKSLEVHTIDIWGPKFPMEIRLNFSQKNVVYVPHTAFG